MSKDVVSFTFDDMRTVHDTFWRAKSLLKILSSHCSQQGEEMQDAENAAEAIYAMLDHAHAVLLDKELKERVRLVRAKQTAKAVAHG